MSLKVGIVGLPNVGKSTLFNALLQRAQAQAENRPFTTIEPNVGIVDMPDRRLDKIYEITEKNFPSSHPKKVPTTIEFVDIAGLVQGAHRGEGLGNQFLSHIREVDAILHVVRFFENDQVIHVENNVNPTNDSQTITIELILADLKTTEKLLHFLQKQAKSPDSKTSKDSLAKLKALQKIESALQREKPAREADLTDEERKLVVEFNLLTLKPELLVANVSESQLNEADEVVPQFLSQKTYIALCAHTEAELVDLSPKEATEYLESIGQSEPGLNKLIHAAYDLLGLQTFFTAGEQEVRAWTVRKGATAPQAAGVIHTDFEKGFIKAETISYEDFITLGGEQEAKKAGKLRMEGKDYIVKDGDIFHFRFNV